MVQIGCNDVPFRLCRKQKESSYDCDDDDEDDDSNLTTTEEGIGNVNFVIGEEEMTLPVGTVGRVVRLPHQIDAGGSFVLEVIVPGGEQGSTSRSRSSNNKSSTRRRRRSMIHILCDVFAVEAVMSDSVHYHKCVVAWNESPDILVQHESLWKDGLAFWGQGGDNLFHAMTLFEESLECFKWTDDDKDEYEKQEDVDDSGRGRGDCGGNTGMTNNRWTIMVPSSFRNSTLRSVVAKRCCFLAMCLADDTSINERHASAVKYFLRSIQTTPMSMPMSMSGGERNCHTNSNCHLVLACAARELVLLFEERNDMTSARAAAQLAMDRGTDHFQWRDKYQRPGFCVTSTTSTSSSLLLEHHDPSAQASVPRSIPFYESNHVQYPKWCQELTRHYATIKQEFLHILSSTSSTSKSSTSKSMILNSVGGDHRASGQHDARVVTAGEWKEVVLFGSGREHHHAATQRTRAILRQCMTVNDDAISLCEAGGGEIIFSVLAPHTHIAPHCAATNLRLTAHLGLVVPPGIRDENEENGEAHAHDHDDADHADCHNTKRPRCAIRVKQTWHTWKEGEVMVFDDSYEHEVVNDTDFPRAVLLLRFWHPSLSGSTGTSSTTTTNNLSRDRHRHRRHVALREIQEQREWSNQLRFTPPFVLPVDVDDESSPYANVENVWDRAY
jgi:hypothetical protein